MCGGWGVPEDDEQSSDKVDCSGKADSNEVNKSRRAFTSASVATPVLASLLSRPAWSSVCSISGLASGNISNAAGTPGVCTSGDLGVGCTPGFWKNKTAAWARTDYSPGICEAFNGGSGNCSQLNSATSTTFISVFGFNPPLGDGDSTLMSVLMLAVQGGGDTLVANHAHQAHWVAAVLNASADPISYGQTAAEVIAAVKSVNSIGPEVSFTEDELHTLLEAMNERGCQFNAHGGCDDNFTEDYLEGRCIPVCGNNQTFDVNSKACIDNANWDANIHTPFDA